MEIKARRNMKDTIFSSLFSTPKYLLELYHALHPEDTQATEDALKMVTIQNVLADGIYNDLGFMVGNRLMILVEAQSTWSMNIILRALLYLAQSYKEYFVENDVNLYSSKKAKLPEPELYVIYTGERSEHPQTISLSEDFFGGKNTALDVRVRVLYGEDKENIIGQYVRFCKVFNSVVHDMGYTKEAIREIIRICQDERILKEYITAREKEAFDIMFVLFDEEYLDRAITKEHREEALAEGRAEGLAKGRAEGSIRSFAQAVKGILSALKIEPEKAMDIAGVPQEYRPAVLAKLESFAE